MIRTDRFTIDVDTFAAERRRILERSDERLTAPVRASLSRLGLPRWEDGIVAAALDIFDETARAEVDEWNPIIDDMREEFERELRETLKKTKPSEKDKEDVQVERMVRWLSTYSVNAGTEAATTSDPNGDVGLEWLSMEDKAVRPTHVEADGQTVPSGLPFEVGGYELLYPGQPVGPPEIWINCRCVARPALLEEFKTKTVDFTADHGVLDVEHPSAIVAAPHLPPAKEAPVKEPTSPVPVVPEDEDPEEEAEDDAPMIPLEEEYEPVPWYGVLAPEGAVSGDGRGFEDGGLRMRDLPLPLKWMPEDAEGHDKSQISGRIDRIWRDNGLIKAEGVFDTSHAAYEAIRQIAEGTLRGVSVDIDDMQATMSDDGDASVATGRICSATLCAIPAFAEAFVALGTWADDGGHAFGGTDIPDAAEPEEPEEEPEDPDEDEFAVSRETFVSEEPWDGSASRFTDEQWKASCILHVCEGLEKSCHKLPIKEPGGALSRAGVHAAAGRINQADASPEQIATAKGHLRGAYKELGEEPPENLTAEGETEEFVPIRTKDGPGWITEPKATERITDYWVHGPGAAKIGWGAPGDFNRCRVQLVKYVQNPNWLAGLCANLHYRALRVWPGQHNVRTQTMPALTAAAGTTLSADWFKDPHLPGPTPFTVTDDGRVYGHVATWDTCHIGLPMTEDECTTAPHSATGYSFFLTGEVQTDVGPVAVGQISLGGGHASAHSGVRAAISHYDSTSTAVADVTAGEDEHGIWVAGALRPNVSDEQVHELRAAAISGDWRQVARGRDDMEMIAALAVNVPGFPIPRPSMLVASGGQTVSLIAASIPLAPGQSTGDSVEIPTTPAEKFGVTRAKFRKLQMERAKKAFVTVGGE